MNSLELGQPPPPVAACGVTNHVRAPSASTEMRAIPCYGGEGAGGTIVSLIHHPLLLMPTQVNWRSLLLLQK